MHAAFMVSHARAHSRSLALSQRPRSNIALKGEGGEGVELEVERGKRRSGEGMRSPGRTFEMF